MIPLYLRLIDFLSHEDTELDSGPIVAACIQGLNGSGKSAIVDGILYALYGKTPRGGGDSLVRIGSSDMTVVFDFEQAGRAYRVVRKRTTAGRGKSVVELFKNGSEKPASWETIATGETAKRRIVEILGRDYDTMTSSSFLLQGQGERVINARPSERHKVVFDVLGCAKYQAYRSRAASRRKELEGHKKALLESISDLAARASLREELEKAKAGVEAEIASLRGETASKENALPGKLSEAALVEAGLRELEAVRAEAEALEQKKAGLKSRVDALFSALPFLPAEIERRVAEKVAEFSSEGDPLQRAAARTAELKTRIEGLGAIEKEISLLIARKEDIGKQITETEGHAERYRKILENREKILSHVEEEKRETSALASIRETLKSFERQVEELDAGLGKAASKEKELIRLQAAVDRMERERLNALKAAQAELASACRDSEMLDHTVCKGEGRYAECGLIKSAVEKRGAVPDLEKRAAELEKPLELKEKEEARALERELSALGPERLRGEKQKAVDEARRLREEGGSLEKRLEALRSWTANAPMIETAETELKRMESALSGCMKEIGDTEKAITDLEERKKACALLKEELDVLGAATERLRVKAEADRIEEEVRAAERKLSELSGRLASWKELEKKLEVLKAEAEGLRRAIASFKEEEKRLLAEDTRLGTEVGLCLKAEAEAGETSRKAEAAGRNIYLYGLLEDAYEKIPFYILDNVVPVMEEMANRVLEEISTTGMRIEFRTERQNKSNAGVHDELDIIVSDVTGERPIEMYSGGEKTRLVLSIAVALAEVSARRAGVKIESIFIDEPAGLDRQGLIDFGTYFIKLVESGEFFKKGFLIAHEELLRDVFEQKILVTRDGPTSEIRVAA